MENRVVITGMGIISPIGNQTETFWNHLTEGYCGISRLEDPIYDTLPVHVAGQVKDFNPTDFGIDAKAARKYDRFALFALAAADQAMRDSGLEGQIEPHRFGVYVGSGVGGLHTLIEQCGRMMKDGPQWISPLFIPNMIINIASGNIAIRYQAQGPCLPVVTACATGTHALGEAFRAIKYGYADAIISGGAEATVNALAIGGFSNSKALSPSEDPLAASLPFDRRRQGFVISEGAGILVLESYQHAAKRGAKIYGEVCGYGNTCDAYHYTAPRPDGSCAARAFRLAAQEAGLTDSDILHINTHGTGTPLNDSSETQAIKTAFGEERARRAVLCSTKSMTGHMLGAAGGVEAIAATLALSTGIVPPTIGLHEPDPACDLNYNPLKASEVKPTIAISSSLGFGGHNACIAIRKI